MTKAVLLLSGGLDSTLAGKVLMDQGVYVEAINFVSPFCRCTPRGLGCSAAKRSAERLGLEVRVFSCGEDYLEVVKHPRFGRGKGMNPCIDCRIYMFKRARQYMIECGADFVATGEVLFERPMSQRPEPMRIIEEKSDLIDLVVRPLSAKLLSPSRPEREGKVKREKLHDIKGRRRKAQMELASSLGIKDFICPGGGCLLTDTEFAARLADILDHEPECSIEDVRMLATGRHFRLKSKTKVVMGRDQQENRVIETHCRQGDLLIKPAVLPGPSALCRSPRTGEDVAVAAGLVLSYMKGWPQAEIKVKHNGAEHAITGLHPLNRDIADALRVCARNGKSRGKEKPA